MISTVGWVAAETRYAPSGAVTAQAASERMKILRVAIGHLSVFHFDDLVGPRRHVRIVRHHH